MNPMIQKLSRGACVLALGWAVAPTQAAIVIDGDFTDWSSVASINTDVSDGTTVDFAEVKAASDDDFVYLYYRLHTATNPQAAPGGGVFLGIDIDANAATGFDIFGFGAVGSEAAWQNDFPFEQDTGNFNTGNGLSDATYLASPFNASGSEVEISIPIIATRNGDGANIFTDGEKFAFAFYTTGAADEDFISGNFTVPEPASLALVGLGGLMMLGRGRSRA